MSDSPVSFNELNAAPPAESAEPITVAAPDGVPLAVRRYLPRRPGAVLVLCHGGGAHGGAGYQYLGAGLRDEHDVALYLPDARGHGASGGPRGDAPRPRALWADLAAVLRAVRTAHPGLPLFLGGHSSGAGLALNYLASEQRAAEPVAGLVFLAPHFGFRSRTQHERIAHPFATGRVWPFLLNAFSRGALLGHYPAVRFHYPEAVFAKDPALLRGITVNAAMAVTPLAPARQLAALARPFALWIGAQDEVLDAGRVAAFAAAAKAPETVARIEVVPDTNHLSILLGAHGRVGEWIAARLGG